MLRLILALIMIASAGLADAQQATRLSETYDLVASHLCEDAEYLSCLQMSAGQCREDLASEPLQQCGQQPYIRRDQPDQGPAAGPVPPAMVECIYSAHIELSGLEASEVNSCMAEAKLRN